MSAAGWSNWSGRVQCPSSPIHRPEDLAALRALITAQRGRGCVRAVGSGHSFVPFWNDGDALVALDAFTGLLALDGEIAALGAGTPIHAIGPLLAARGRALANQGDIDRQAIAGAVATGTHGTGRGLGSLSSAVSRLELVDGTGEVRVVDAPGTLAAARVSLGLLGIMTAVSLRTVPLYGLHERSWQEAPDTTIASFEARLDAHRHHEFWWVPSLDRAIAKTLSHIDVPEEVRLDEIPFGESGERWGASWQVFPSARDTRFNELEFAVPAEAGMACFAELRSVLLDRFPKLPWPVEYRVVAGDDAWLSPTAGVEVAAISVHQDARRDPEPLFACVEPILRAYGGRPHWGKCHALDASAIASLYPRLPDFEAVRRTLDPDAVFRTRWLEALLAGGREAA